MSSSHSRGATFWIAWLALGINLIAILGGALVRATGSGAGCGTHWPTCHGSLLPDFGDLHTRVEFAHRAFSGMALVIVVALFANVHRNFEKGSVARTAALLSVVAIFVECLLGAWLVVAGLVEDNATVMRAISVPIHLVNTQFLLAALTITVWAVGTERTLRWGGNLRTQLLIAALGLTVLSATGAVAALADTLFPAEVLSGELAADFDHTSHFLTRLRVAHPVAAVGVSFYLLLVASRAYENAPRYAAAVMGLVVLQLVVGLVNIAALTPVLIQILHLLVADVLWIAVLLLAAELGAEPTATTGTHLATHRRERTLPSHQSR